MALLPVTLNSPGSWGLNLQEADQLIHPNWATITDGLQLNKSGQLAARGSFTITTTTPAAAELLRIHNYINASGVEIIISATATTMWQSVGDLTASGNNISPSGAPTAGYWKFLNFNGKCLAWQAGHTPLYYTGSGDFTVITAASGTLPDGDAAHSAFGRVWAVDDDKQTVRYSALLDETKWAAADGGGSIDMRNVWTQGLDYVTAISSIGSNLVIFGRKHIVIYSDGQGSTLGVDPTQMYVVDVVEGTGCVARDTVTPVGEGDLIFLSEVGFQSLGRVVQSKDNPLVSLSWQIGDHISSIVKAELASQSVPYTDARGFTAFYTPTTDQAFLIHKRGTIEDVYVFHVGSRQQDDKGREFVPITYWDTSVLTNLRAMTQSRGGTIYAIGGLFNHINTYDPDGALDNGISPIYCNYESGWMAWADPELAQLNKTLKFAQVTHGNPSELISSTVFKYGTDYAETLEELAAADSDSAIVRNIYDTTGDTDGQNFKIGVEDTRFGGKALHQIVMHFKPGRIAFVHDIDGQGAVTASAPNSGLQLLVAVSSSNNSTSCVQTSMNGIDWTIRTAIQAAWAGVCYSPDLHLLVAVAANSIMTSPDGINWTSRTSPGNGGWASVVWSRDAGKFIAVGQSLTTQRVMSSTDGITWTLQTTPSNCDRTWTSVIWSNHLRLFVAGQSSNTANGLMTSPDGVTWTRRTYPAQDSQYLVESATQIIAAQGGDTDIAYSPDGFNWANLSAVLPSTTGGGVAYSPTLDLFAVASGVSSSGIYTAPGKGTPSTWTGYATSAFQFNCALWSSNLERFVFMDALAGVYSDDGTTWTALTPASSQNWVSICETEEV